MESQIEMEDAITTGDIQEIQKGFLVVDGEGLSRTENGS